MTYIFRPSGSSAAGRATRGTCGGRGHRGPRPDTFILRSRLANRMPESEYEVDFFRTEGFRRLQCASCGKFFWTLGDHSICGERPCQEYDFIGNSPFKKSLTVRAMREDFISFMEANGHTRVRRYPIVARWRDDVFFVQASVYPFQPGGISGPCLEVVFGGAEAATLVFMQYRDTNGHRVPMETTVVDTGYGLERLVWLSQGTTSAYEAVFGDALAYLKRATGAKKVDGRVLTEYSKVAGMFDVETAADVRAIRAKTAARLGISVEELVTQRAPLGALAVICDHSRALMFLLGDGVVPSNSREGDFARLLIRRGRRTPRNLDITYSMADTISFLIDQNREDYPELFFNKGDILKLLKVEEQRYRDTLEKGRATVQRLEERVRAAGGQSIGLGALIELYDSHGLTPDVVKEFATLGVDVPDDFFSQVARRHERTTEPEATKRIDLPP